MTTPRPSVGVVPVPSGGYPAAVEHDLRPPGQVNAIVAPLDALRAAGRDDLDIAGRATMRARGDCRRTGAGAGRVGRADAALPNQDAHAIRRLHHRELHVGAFGEPFVRGQRGTQAVETFAIRQLLYQLHALRIADRQRRHGQRLTGHVEGFLPDALRLPHGRAEGVTRTGPANQRQRFPPGVGVDAHFVDRRPRRLFALVQYECGQTAQAVAGQLRRAAVGVDQLHARRTFRLVGV